MNKKSLLKQILKPIAPVFILLILLNSCSNNENQEHNRGKNSIIEKGHESAKQNEPKKEIPKIIVKGKSLIFFKLGKSDYKKFIKAEGEYIKYEFDALFSNFTNRAKSVERITKKEKINSFITTANKISFVLKSGDTVVFNRKEKDFVIGQIFFNGTDSPRVEDGLIKANEFKKMIKDYYKLDSIAELEPDTLIQKNDSLKNIIKTDTIINKDKEAVKDSIK